MTLPKGKPKEITSASVTSLGSLRTWITRDGTPALLLSPLNFLLSFPLAVKSKSYCLLEWVWKNMHTYNFWHIVCAPHPVITLYYREIPKSNLTRVWRHMAPPPPPPITWCKWHSWMPLQWNQLSSGHFTACLQYTPTHTSTLCRSEPLILGRSFIPFHFDWCSWQWSGLKGTS